MGLIFNDGEVRQLAVDLGRAGSKVTVLASRAVRKTAFDAERIMKREEPVDTGAMRNSTGVTVSNGGLYAEVGPTVHYAPFVAYGTSKQRPNPFDQRTVALVEPAFLAAMEQLGGQILGS